MNTLHKLGWVTGVAAALSLGGCWLDDDDDEPTPPVATGTVPDSAGASGTAFVSYLLTLSGDDESTEPLLLPDTLAVPADDAGEPQTL